MRTLNTCMRLPPNVQTHVFEGLEHSFRDFSPNQNFVDSMAQPLSRKYLKYMEEFFSNFNNR